jgi:hypothetical protein
MNAGQLHEPALGLSNHRTIKVLQQELHWAATALA